MCIYDNIKGVVSATSTHQNWDLRPIPGYTEKVFNSCILVRAATLNILQDLFPDGIPTWPLDHFYFYYLIKCIGLMDLHIQ